MSAKAIPNLGGRRLDTIHLFEINIKTFKNIYMVMSDCNA